MADQQTYTLAEAAATLGLPEDGLFGILPDAGIDLTARGSQTLTDEDMRRLGQLMATRAQRHPKDIHDV